MKKLIGKVSGLLSKSSITVLSLSVVALDFWGSGCSLFFYESKEPEALQNIDLKELRKTII